ncbi:universal stress protein [Haloarcula amylovorans]|uniref:universal stress protein n=1 Tax=Haloarcula amylovorans TaxID=2562280 RepID=UPI001076138B|nr:universal stress protein [Halomicroarcula amylolytica]
MPAPLFTHALVPVSSPKDAKATMRAIRPYLESAGGDLTVVNVIEKAGGAPDKASVEQREAYAREIFDSARDALADSELTLTTEIRYGTDVAETIIETAHELDASAIVFTPRGGSRWLRLLTGDVALSLVSESDLPVIALPDHD